MAWEAKNSDLHQALRARGAQMMMASAPARGVLVTRSFPANIGTAQAVRHLGWIPVIAPLLAIRPVEWSLDMRQVGAIAFTSPNAARVAGAADIPRDLPVFAVGDATARAAQVAGWRNVASAAGDVHDLVRLIVDHRDRFSGRVLHLSAREPAGDLRGDLNRMGIRAASQVVYATEFAPPAALLMQLQTSEDMAGVLIFSPKSAARFADLVEGPRQSARIVCISEAAAKPLQAAGCAQVIIAQRPNEASMLAALGPFPARQLI